VLDDVTSDFVYVRLHGDQELYVSGYGDVALDRWAARVRTWALGGTPADGRTLGPKATVRERDVFVYFDNDAKVHAPFDAIGLARRLGIRDLSASAICRPVATPRQGGSQRPLMVESIGEVDRA
jgi:uncharacterized protein YecE (DUF72 family)